MKRAIITAAALSAAIMAGPVMAAGNSQLRAEVAPWVQNVQMLTVDQLVQIKNVIEQGYSTSEKQRRIEAIVS